MREVPPGVSVYATAKEALAHMPAILHGDPPPDLDALAKQHAGAFFVTLPVGSVHGSDTTISDVHAVFVQPKRVTVVHRINESYHVIPNPSYDPRDCNRASGEEPEIAIVNPHLGHLRMIRRIDHGEPTAPVTPPRTRSEKCPQDPCKELVRVEDHFINLDTGRHLRTLAQVYETECYNPGTPQIYAFSKLVPTDEGVEIAGTSCNYFWDE